MVKQLLVVLGVVALPAAARADSSYSVKVEAPAATHAKRAVVKIHLAPGAGFHLNTEYPTAVSLTAPADVVVEKAKLTSKDAVKFAEAGADFEVALVPAQAGKKELTGELKFAVCNADSCNPKKEKLSFTVEVK